MGLVAAAEPDEPPPPPPPHPANSKVHIVVHNNAVARFSRAVECGGGNVKAFSNRCENMFTLKIRLAIDYIILRSCWVMPGVQFGMKFCPSGAGNRGYKNAKKRVATGPPACRRGLTGVWPYAL